jgi:hypothetical protein
MMDGVGGAREGTDGGGNGSRAETEVKRGSGVYSVLRVRIEQKEEDRELKFCDGWVSKVK